MNQLLELVVVVNGQPTQVQVSEEAVLLSVIPRALEQTGNVGQPPDNWELRDVAGTLLDISKKVEQFRFAPGTRLFLNLKAGIGGNRVVQSVDPEVSIRKFEREIADFRRLAPTYHKRGWFIASADFPTILVLIAAPQLKPPALVMGVLFNYEDYDLRPPSVRLVDPFSGAPYKINELPIPLVQTIEVEPVIPPGFVLPPGAQLGKMLQRRPLMQAYGVDDIPFLCLAGVREYHDHPGHSGDAWELHRTAGAGKLVRILGVLDRHGVSLIGGYNVELVPQITGFVQQ